jgi:hypothetical protein
MHASPESIHDMWRRRYLTAGAKGHHEGQTRNTCVIIEPQSEQCGDVLGGQGSIDTPGAVLRRQTGISIVMYDE